MASLDGALIAAEVLKVRDGLIVRGELICDAEGVAAGDAPRHRLTCQVVVVCRKNASATASSG